MKTKRRKTRESDFKPNRDQIQTAVEEYLSKGGTIKMLKPEEELRSIRIYVGNNGTGGNNA